LLTSVWVSVPGISQEWSEPVEVSDIEGAYLDPDMCIDNNGVIHVVWSSGTFGSNNWQILYSKSEDNGETWSVDFDVSQNDTLWMSQPHIAVDSENKLYVTYDYNTMQPPYMHVLMKIYNGQQWSDSILITEGMQGSDYNKLFVDNNNRVFIGWYNSSRFYYRFYENGTLSQPYCPYCDSNYTILPVDHVLSSNSIVHWIGSSYKVSDWRLEYFKFNVDNNSWDSPIQLRSDKANLVGKDIDLNHEENPEICFREATDNSLTYDGTFFMSNDGQQWNQAELVVEDPQNQQIAIDQYNQPHIVNREKTATGSQIVHYRKINSEWIGYIIDSTSNFCHPTKLLFHNNQLYLIYFRDFTPGFPDVNIMFTKYDVITNIEESQADISGLVIYPNPSVGITTIDFKLNKKGRTSLIINDFYGRHVKTILDQNIAAGKYSIKWDGKNDNGANVKSGLYLCRLYKGKNVITKSIQIIR
jgi:hypothetical protein